MSTFVRVRLPNGREASLNADYVKGLGAGALEVLDEPATDLRGRPRPVTRKDGRPVKPATTVSKEAAKKAVKKSETPAPPDATNTDEEDAPVVTPEEGN